MAELRAVNSIELWGMSELSGVATGNRPGATRIGMVGHALPGVELALAEDGELLCRGPLVMKGYCNDPEKRPTPSTPTAGFTPPTSPASTTTGMSPSSTARRSCPPQVGQPAHRPGRLHRDGRPWEPGGDELTPTMKLKRRPIAGKYAVEMEALYAAGG